MRQFAIFLLVFVGFVYSIEANEAPVEYRNNLKQVSEKINKGTLKNYELYGIQNQLERMQYQSQFIELNNIVMNVDTDNKVLKQKIDMQQKYFETTLSEQKKQYEAELNMQQKHYEAALNHLTALYSIVIGALAVIGFVLNWIGWGKLKAFIQSFVSQEHSNAIEEVTKKLSSDSHLYKRIESLVKIEVEKQSGKSFEGGVE